MRWLLTVKLMRAGDVGDDSLNCLSQLEQWDLETAPSSGTLSTRAEVEEEQPDPCIIPASAGFRGLENQLYRVEVHRVNSESEITIKWSRENGSVVAAWEDQSVVNPDVLTVSTAGRDDVLGFAQDNWIELTDDRRELHGEPGILVKILSLSNKDLTIDPGSETVDRDTGFSLNPKVRRWVMPGNTGEITVNLSITDNWIDLESGVQVRFETTGDYWMIPARTATGDIEWPNDEVTGDPLPQSPQGILHHYCRLALIAWSGEEIPEPENASRIRVIFRSTLDPATVDISDFVVAGASPNGLTFDPVQPDRIILDVSPYPLETVPEVQIVGTVLYVSSAPATIRTVEPVTAQGLQAIEDCRPEFPALTELISLYYVGGDGQEAMPGGVLAQPLQAGVSNGQWPVDGALVELRILEPAGGILSTADVSGDTIQVRTDDTGLTSCEWQLDTVNESQVVEALLLDAAGDPIHLPLRFSANLSVASGVANITDCPMLAGEPTVQDALDKLCANSALHAGGGDGQEAVPGEELCAALEVRLANGREPVPSHPVQFEIEVGNGELTDVTDATNAGTTIEVTTDQNGMAACRWRLGGDSSDVCQRARSSAEGLDLLPVVFNANLSLADRVAYDPADCPSLQAANVTTVQQAIDALCNLGQPDDPGIKITDVLVQLTNRSLVNDGDLLMGDLEQGLQVVCDQKIDPVTIGRPTCYVTLEHPFFIDPISLEGHVGFQPIVLAADVGVAETAEGDSIVITWAPVPDTFFWLQSQLKNFIPAGITRLLVRLTLKGNFISAEGDTGMFLDGEALGEALGAARGTTPTALELPSGDGRSGGDFEMWWWIVESQGPNTVRLFLSGNLAPTELSAADFVVPDVTVVSAVLDPAQPDQIVLTLDRSFTVESMPEVTMVSPLLEQDTGGRVTLVRLEAEGQ